jgi:hypothetical protein
MALMNNTRASDSRRDKAAAILAGIEARAGIVPPVGKREQAALDAKEAAQADDDLRWDRSITRPN